jgi:hypothetical protein
LAQFQNRRFAKEEVWQLLVDLNKRLEKPLDPSNLRAPFDNWWWPDVEEKAIAALASAHVDAPKEPKRGQTDLLEELLVRVRNIEHSLVDRSIEADSADVGRGAAHQPRNVVRHHATAQGQAGRRMLDMLDHLGPEQRSILKAFFDEGYLAARAMNFVTLIDKHRSHDVELLVNAGLIEVDNTEAFIRPSIASALGDKLRSIEAVS